MIRDETIDYLQWLIDRVRDEEIEIAMIQNHHDRVEGDDGRVYTIPTGMFSVHFKKTEEK